MNTEWKYEWANPDEFASERRRNAEAHDAFVKKWKGRDDFKTDVNSLKEALTDYENLTRDFYHGGTEGYYYWLHQELNETDLEIRAKYNQIVDFIKEQDNKITFFAIELGKVTPEKQKEFLESSELRDYKNLLKNIFLNSKYLLGEKEEEIMSLKSTSAYSMWVRMTSSLLVKETVNYVNEEGKTVEKTYPELLSLMESSKAKVRKNANDAFVPILKKFEDVAEAEFNAILENKKVNDKIRGFEKAEDSRLISDEVEPEMIEALLSSVQEKFNLSERFYKLKSKLLGLEKLKYYERAASYGSVEKNYSYEDSVELIKKVFKNLDEKFLEVFESFLKNSRIDVYPKKGKRMGAFCVRTSIKLPTYILLNHAGTLNEVTTIAHELGHGINNELIRQKQNALNFDVSTATAEVASTFMEDFVFEELLREADDEEKLTILMEKLNSDVSSIFRQIAFFLFEREIHESYRKDGYLSKTRIGEIFKKQIASYMGQFVDVEESNIWWVYVPHFREFFYTYSYASGLLISKALQEKVKQNPEFINEVKKFLETGTSLSPKETFMQIGLDITKKEFWDEGLNKVEKLLSQTEELAKKLGKI